MKVSEMSKAARIEAVIELLRGMPEEYCHCGCGKVTKWGPPLISQDEAREMLGFPPPPEGEQK